MLKCCNANRQERFFLIFGAFQLAAAARRRRQAFAEQLMESVTVAHGVPRSVAWRTYDSRCPFAEHRV
jgi:hypothetical protein